MNHNICRTFIRRSLLWRGGSVSHGRITMAGSAAGYRSRVATAVYYGKLRIAGCYWASRVIRKNRSGVLSAVRSLTSRRLWRLPVAGPISVRWPMRSAVRFQSQGFSLTESLIALLILSLGVVMLSGYHQQLVTAYRLQWAQRDAAWAATRLLAGKPVAGWENELKQEVTAEGCRLVTAQVRGRFNRHFRLQQLFCPPFGQRLPE